MKLLDLTLDSLPENLALDEALLEEAEAGRNDDDVLRLWESQETAVIIGRSSRIEDEVNLSNCEHDNVSVLRRCSGGTSVVIGRGCLMYAVVLSYERNPALRMVDVAHRYVLGNVAMAVNGFIPNATLRGTSDLTLGDRKFSGNSLRCKRDHLLYHGTLLCDFALASIGRYLKTPPRQPDYRRERDHLEFVTNLGVSREELRNALRSQWRADEALDRWPELTTNTLVAQRYRQSAWHHRL
ncbi:MAG: lipoate--protein ligase family protein [Planctomycetaceae bacterium]|nr:lipoate--protein ligase family protein [Planctomycetales bacterium]MCB9926042.1 lipoate--protein ligase family protein [Planctomycetaceae bacterium]